MGNEVRNGGMTNQSLSIILILSAITLFGVYLFKIIRINKGYRELYDREADFGLRKFPYPYKAALAIASDIDSTGTVERFLKIQEFLDTKNVTEMGEGVGLEIGNSFFMFHPRGMFSYFSGNEKDRDTIRKFVKAGYMDCLHSWGDGYKDRNDAIAALEELEKNNLNVKVWINHSDAKSNFGDWPDPNAGDDAESEHYHADLTISYGIRFAWLGNLTGIVGQATPVTLSLFAGSYDPRYPFGTAINTLKNVAKNVLPQFGLCKRRYSLQAENELVKVVSLKDGRKVFEFSRYDSHPDGVGKGADNKRMAYNLSDRVLAQLKKVNGYGILYTHFGKNFDCRQDIHEDTQMALRNLEKEYRSGNIYVTTTYKLLNYYVTHKYLRWSIIQTENVAVIDIHSVEDPVSGTRMPSLDDLQGITFYVPAGAEARVRVAGAEIRDIMKNRADETGRESVTIPFRRNPYPESGRSSGER